MKKLLLFVTIGLTMFLSSCKVDQLILVTTTTLDGSGFLDFIIPYFEDEYDVSVKVVAMATGAALQMGEMGEADIVLVHDYDSEMVFMANGFGEKRSNVMYNDFLFVGPTDLGTTTLEETLAAIYNKLNFYSRGDLSGTHLKELKLWDLYGYDVSTFGDWYKETGQGMLTTLNMTSLSGYYTLVDRATYSSIRDVIDLIPVYENAQELINQYGVIKVNTDLHNRDDMLADLFYDWIIRSDTQDLIATYIMYDTQLFYPNAEE